ncbi:hypothetical protein [Anaeromyxobacter paludicola]|uniref:Uncharacterized protein n=1 Tax=Anaeromyxobacter paludicola TaxID=2918171 RepID=A0ABM7X6Z5_9BACT|nr:hypothetical protein [Anaeromyxobacter paludicola]BDG07611.1 hypothetical protein AMPC_07240 [Anaeromyxobacter paludicola]
MRSEADFVFGLLDVAAARLPPHQPLSAEEKTSIRTPLEETIYKYGGNMDPAVALAIGLTMIGVNRYVCWKMLEAEKNKPPEPKAAPASSPAPHSQGAIAA